MMSRRQPESAYELMVMFFGLINSLATFLAIINDLLRDLTEVGDVVVFIVKTKIEEAHHDIVEKVLRKIAENNLLVKLEKYV